jgi:hypothetical protein
MPAIKSAAQIAAKWSRVTPQRSSEYQQGVQAPRTSWKQATTAAVDRYKSGVQESLNQGRWEKGVNAAGDEYWSQRAAQIGTSRFAEGVAVAAPNYEAGFAPFAETIKNTQLPPRYAKGDPRNLERVRVMSTALRKRKTGV